VAGYSPARDGAAAVGVAIELGGPGSWLRLALKKGSEVGDLGKGSGRLDSNSCQGGKEERKAEVSHRAAAQRVTVGVEKEAPQGNKG